MIRFVDIAKDAKPMKAPAPTSEEKVAAPVAAASETTKSEKTPRKPKRPA